MPSVDIFSTFVVVVYFIFLSLVGVRSQEVEVVSIVDVHKCPGSKIQIGEIISVPNEYFETDINLRISKESFPGCSGSETQESSNYLFLDKLSEEEFEKYERRRFIAIFNNVSLTPSGYLSVRNHFYPPEEYCVQDFKRMLNSQNESAVTDLTFKFCQYDCIENHSASLTTNRPCINACCPIGASWDMNANSCRPSGTEIWKGFFYDRETWRPLNLNLNESGDGDNDEKHTSVRFKPRYWYYRLNCKLKNNDTTEIWTTKLVKEQDDESKEVKVTIKLLTDGSLQFISGRRKWEALKDFCVGGMQNYGHNLSIITAYSGKEDDQVVAICSKDEKISPHTSQLYMFSLFFAAIFYFLTAFFLGVLYDTQNINGWSVFAMTCSLFCMMVFVGNAHRLGLYGDHTVRDSLICIVNGILAHYFYMASFAWLAIINYNVWSAFRVLKPRNEKDNFTELYYYLLTGFGCPLIVVIVGFTLDRIYPDVESLILVPEYGKNICFVAEHAQGVYIFYPLGLPFGIIVMLFIHTVYKLYIFQQDTARVRSSSSAGDRKMFQLFAKLSIVLGISWIFEFLSWMLTRMDTQQHWLWTIPDLYNLLTSVFVFYIFVCKRQTVNQLEVKYPFVRPVTRKLSVMFSSEKQPLSNEPSGNTASSQFQTGSGSTKEKVELKGVTSGNGIQNKGNQQEQRTKL